MNNGFPSRETVNRLREQYPEGTRVELVSMNDPYSKLVPGDRGTVSRVDDIGTIFVDWDKGSGLGIAYGEDICRKVTERTYETGADFFRDTAVSHGTDEALGICGRYLATQLGNEQSREEHQFCRELFTAIHEAAAQHTDPAKLVYPYDFQKASDRAEASFYHDSRKRNAECAHAIDEAIHASCYKVNFYNLDIAAMKAVHDFGFTRVNQVLAHNFQQRGYDGRFSTSNKKWAQDIPVVDKVFGGATLDAHPILIESFTNHARKLYEDVGAERFTLPGAPDHSEDVHGYDIIRAIHFDNQRGFAIGLNPDAVNDYAVWQFTVENGKRDFYWGNYSDDLGSAAQNYIARIMVHMDSENVREIPNSLAAVEMSTEQNYNMIDGLRNNEAVPPADLTDGQTHDELRELAPETLPGPKGKPSLLEQVDKIKSELPPHTPSGRSGPPEREL